MTKIVKFSSVLFLLLHFCACELGPKIATSDSNEKVENTKRDAKPEIEVDISNEEVAELYLKSLKIEDYVRTEPENSELVEVGQAPYVSMRKDVDTEEKLRKYLSQVYTKKAVDDYINNLDVAVIDKENHIGRIAIYFYTKDIDFDKPIEALVLKKTDSTIVYRIIATWDEEIRGEPNKKDTLNNFVIRKEQDIWKIDVMPNEMHGR